MTPEGAKEQQLALDDEQFARLLDERTRSAGNPSPDQDVENLAAALRTYRQQATHWAECRSAAQPSLAQAALRHTRWGSLPRWALASVACVTLGVGGAYLAGHQSTGGSVLDVSTSSTVEEADNAPATDLAADNEMLSTIDAALSYHSASPVDALHLREPQAARTPAAETAD